MWYTRDKESLMLKLYVQPGAKHNEVLGLHGDALKIKLNTLPIEGRANEALLKYVAQLFEVPARQVSLKRGDKSRFKTLCVWGSLVDPESLTYLTCKKPKK
ncbi:MAG: YggU family protein [Gammaproteobacteria bacterium]|nr:YggU family protein [Gammaproteobacteria bacterium]